MCTIPLQLRWTDRASPCRAEAPRQWPDHRESLFEQAQALCAFRGQQRKRDIIDTQQIERILQLFFFILPLQIEQHVWTYGQEVTLGVYLDKKEMPERRREYLAARWQESQFGRTGTQTHSCAFHSFAGGLLSFKLVSKCWRGRNSKTNATQERWKEQGVLETWRRSSHQQKERKRRRRRTRQRRGQTHTPNERDTETHVDEEEDPPTLRSEGTMPGIVRLTKQPRSSTDPVVAFGGGRTWRDRRS